MKTDKETISYFLEDAHKVSQIESKGFIRLEIERERKGRGEEKKIETTKHCV